MAGDARGPLERLFARMLQVVRYGVITATRQDGPVLVAQIRRSSMELQDNRPVVQDYGFVSRPLPGAQAVVVAPGGEPGNAVIIATGDQRYTLRIAPGAVAMFTDEGDSVLLDRGRVVKIIAGTRLDVTAPTVKITGNLEVTGSIRDGVGTLDALRDAYDAHRHPETGSITGTTDHPV